jgi:hypothetical protein
MENEIEAEKPGKERISSHQEERLVRLLRADRPWREYPLGTMAHSCTGGHWLKMDLGWKWNGPEGNGGTFPTPGGNACGACIELPEPNAPAMASADDKTPPKETTL